MAKIADRSNKNDPDWFWDLATWRTARTLTIQGPKSRQASREDEGREWGHNFLRISL